MDKNTKSTSSSNSSVYVTLFIVLIPTFLVIGVITRGLGTIFFKVGFFSSGNLVVELFITWFFGVIGAALLFGAMISIGFLAKTLGLADAMPNFYKNDTSTSTNNSSSWYPDYEIEREKPKKPSWGDLIFDSFDPKRVEEVNKHIEEKKREEQEYLNRKYPGKNQ